MSTRALVNALLLTVLLMLWVQLTGIRDFATARTNERQKSGEVAPAPQAVTVAKRRAAARQQPVEDDGKLRIICFGAHPDDAEYKSGGTAAKWVRAGHHVKLVSVTNGDIGHWQMAGGALAKRRIAESTEVARRLGCEAEILDIHDGVR